MKAQRSDSLWPLSFDQESGGGVAPAGNDVSSVSGSESRCAAQLSLLGTNRVGEARQRAAHKLTPQEIFSHGRKSLVQRQSLATFF